MIAFVITHRPVAAGRENRKEMEKEEEELIFSLSLEATFSSNQDPGPKAKNFLII